MCDVVCFLPTLAWLPLFAIGILVCCCFTGHKHVTGVTNSMFRTSKNSHSLLPWTPPPFSVLAERGQDKYTSPLKCMLLGYKREKNLLTDDMMKHSKLEMNPEIEIHHINKHCQIELLK
jgi:hypothetical protein